MKDQSRAGGNHVTRLQPGERGCRICGSSLEGRYRTAYFCRSEACKKSWATVRARRLQAKARKAREKAHPRCQECAVDLSWRKTEHGPFSCSVACQRSRVERMILSGG